MMMEETGMRMNKSPEHLPLSRLAEIFQEDSEKKKEECSKALEYFLTIFYEREGLALDLSNEIEKNLKLMRDINTLNRKLTEKEKECKMLKHRIKLLLRESKGYDCEG